MRPALLLCLMIPIFLLSSCDLLRGDGRVLLGTKILYVDSQTVTCQGAHEQQYLRVREPVVMQELQAMGLLPLPAAK